MKLPFFNTVLLREKHSFSESQRLQKWGLTPTSDLQLMQFDLIPLMKCWAVRTESFLQKMRDPKCPCRSDLRLSLEADLHFLFLLLFLWVTAVNKANLWHASVWKEAGLCGGPTSPPHYSGCTYVARVVICRSRIYTLPNPSPNLCAPPPAWIRPRRWGRGHLRLP